MNNQRNAAPVAKRRSFNNLQRKVRNDCGMTIGLTVSICFLLVVLSGAFLTFSLITFGSNEVRNAVDAGTLNLGQQVFTLGTGIQGADEQQYADLADWQGRFTLTNINRVWGKALLAAINVRAMQVEST